MNPSRIRSILGDESGLSRIELKSVVPSLWRVISAGINGEILLRGGREESKITLEVTKLLKSNHMYHKRGASQNADRKSSFRESPRAVATLGASEGFESGARGTGSCIFYKMEADDECTTQTNESSAFSL